MAYAFLFKVIGNGLLGLCHFHAVKKAGVYHAPVFAFGVCFLADVSARNYFYYWQIEGLCEFIVARVVRGNGHYCARAVAHQYIVGNPYGYLLLGNGVDCAHAFKHNACLFLIKLAAFKVALVGGLLAVFGNGVPVGYPVLIFVYIWMFGAYYHVCCAEERVRTGGVNGQLIVRVCYYKVHLSAFAAAYPVALLRLNALNVVHLVQVVYKLLRVFGYFEHPLAAHHLYYLPAAAFAYAVYDLLVGKANLAGGAEVYGYFRLVGKAVLVKLKENPLRPFIVFRVRRAYLSGPIEGVAQPFKLRAEAGNVSLRHLGGVYAGFYGVVLRGQAECIVAHGEQHIVAFQPALAANNVHCRERARVPNVKPLAGRIGEFDKPVKLGLGVIRFGFVAMRFFPALLPFQLYRVVFVAL